MRRKMLAGANRALGKFGFRLVPVSPNPIVIDEKVDKLFVDNFLNLLRSRIKKSNAEERKILANAQKYFSRRRAAAARLLLDECDRCGIAIDDRSLLDVGCHAGFLVSLIAARYPTCRAHGCDIVAARVDVASRLCPEANFFVAGLVDLPLDQEFDVVVCTQVLEHLEDPYRAVDRLLSITARGGSLVLTVPDGRQDQFPAHRHNAAFGSYWGHINFWSPESWPLFLKRAAPNVRVESTKLATGQLAGVIFKP